MRSSSVYANPTCPAAPATCWACCTAPPRRRALVMILLSCQRWPSAAIAELLGCDPFTVRRWIHRYNTHGVAGLQDRPRAGGRGWAARHFLADPTPPRPRGGRLARPRLVAKGDPDRDQILADLRQTIAVLPEGAVVLAEDETHINLLP